MRYDQKTHDELIIRHQWKIIGHTWVLKGDVYGLYKKLYEIFKGFDSSFCDTLNLTGISVKKKDLPALSQFFSDHSSVKNLVLSRVFSGRSTGLSAFLNEHPQIKGLIFDGNFDYGDEMLSYLASKTCLESIEFSENVSAFDVVDNIAEGIDALNNNQHLTNFKFDKMKAMPLLWDQKVSPQQIRDLERKLIWNSQPAAIIQLASLFSLLKLSLEDVGSFFSQQGANTDILLCIVRILFEITQQVSDVSEAPCLFSKPLFEKLKNFDKNEKKYLELMDKKVDLLKEIFTLKEKWQTIFSPAPFNDIKQWEEKLYSDNLSSEEKCLEFYNIACDNNHVFPYKESFSVRETYNSALTLFNASDEQKDKTEQFHSALIKDGAYGLEGLTQFKNGLIHLQSSSEFGQETSQEEPEDSKCSLQ